MVFLQIQTNFVKEMGFLNIWIILFLFMGKITLFYNIEKRIAGVKKIVC